MKFTELTVARQGIAGPLHLCDLHPSLNILLVDGESDARNICHAVRQNLFSPDMMTAGKLASPLLHRWLDRDIFDAFYTVELEPDAVSVQHTGRILRDRLAFLHGRAVRLDEMNLSADTRQDPMRPIALEPLLSEKQSLESELALVSREVETLVQKQSEWESVRARNVNQFERQLAPLHSQMSDIEGQIVNVQRDLEHLVAELERAQRELRYEPIQHPRGDRLGILYDYLDDIEQEWRRWRHAADHLQQQRFRLRDEMAQWKQMPISDPQHPYHVVEQILQGLAGRIQDVVEATENGLNENVRQSIETARAETLKLSDELGRQFRQIRHRAAATELKQTRELLQSIEDWQTTLETRRQRLLTLIGQLDSVGAEAIALAQPDFVAYAGEHGYLSARRHFVGPEPATGEIQYRLVRPDTTALQQSVAERRLDLDELTSRRAACRREIEHIEHQRETWFHTNLRPTEIEVVSQRHRQTLLRTRLEFVRKEIHRLASEVTNHRMDAHGQADETLTRAALMIRRLTDGRIVGINPLPIGYAWELEDSQGLRISWENTDPDLRSRVVFCIRIAACVTLCRQGIAAPCVALRILDRLSLKELSRWTDELREVAAAGVQMLVVTCQDSVFRHFESWEQLGSARIFDCTTLAGRALPRLSPDNRTLESAFAFDTVQVHAQNWKAPWKPVIYVDETQEPLSLVDVHGTQLNGFNWSASPAWELYPNQTQVDESMPLSRIDLVDSIQVKHFQNAGIETVRDLLTLTPERLPESLLHDGILPGQIDRWQAQAELMLSIPGLMPRDARLLVGCGIADVEQLVGESSSQILARMSRYLASPDGRRLGADETRYTMDRIRDWQSRATSSTQLRARLSVRRALHHAATPPTAATAAVVDRTTSVPRTPGRYFSQSRQSRYDVGNYFHLDAPRDEPTHPSTTSARQPSSNVGMANPASAQRLQSAPPRTPHADKFYLHLSDPVEAAPSIGPKTAERFTAIGVQTIADLLRHSADSMAEKIAFKRISGDVIRQWQQQTRLVLQVPNLRGHDAQLLVACGVTEAEQLAEANPRELFDRVAPFADSKEGIKIVRAGKKPDLAEVSDWIRWAQSSRSLQAA